VKVGKPAVNQKIFNGKRRICDPTFVANVAAQVANDRHLTIQRLAEAHGVSTRMIHATLHEDVHL
jgi:hypothetical protein